MYQRNVLSVNGFHTMEIWNKWSKLQDWSANPPGTRMAVVNYLDKPALSTPLHLASNDFPNDKKSQRTGYATKYSETMLMLSHWESSTVQSRLELRCEHAWDQKSYDKETRINQLTFASEVVSHF